MAEGDAYGNDSGGGNSTFYSLQAVISAGAAGFFGLAPNAVRITLGILRPHSQLDLHRP